MEENPLVPNHHPSSFVPLKREVTPAGWSEARHQHSWSDDTFLPHARFRPQGKAMANTLQGIIGTTPSLNDLWCSSKWPQGDKHIFSSLYRPPQETAITRFLPTYDKSIHHGRFKWQLMKQHQILTNKDGEAARDCPLSSFTEMYR